jgi:uncharacterized Zn finger protein
MEALVETTGTGFPEHTYLLDGNNLVAYVKANTTEPFYFKNPIKGFDKRGRKFVKGNITLFTVKNNTYERTVQGSKGQTYTVNDSEKTCTCPGFTFRGACKHLAEHV